MTTTTANDDGSGVYFSTTPEVRAFIYYKLYTLTGMFQIITKFVNFHPLNFGWLGGVVARALDSRSIGRGFNSRPVHCRTATLGKLLTPMCLCHQAV